MASSTWKSAKLMLALLGLVGWLLPVPSLSKEFYVGPDQQFAEIGDVPWESLQAGDKVQIYWRAEPYRSKWVICRRGEPNQPITISGVSNDKGKWPVIDGQNATTRRQLDYWHEQRSVIKVGGANSPADTFPAHIVIENLEVRGGRPPNRYQGRKGPGSYAAFAAGIFVEKGEHITIRNCTLTDNANGLLVASQSKSVLVEQCWIYGNGVEGNVYAHNVYTSAEGMTFQFNRFGPLRKGCPGNNLKDRSAGLLVHCNWIEGGNQQLDLVDAEDRESLRGSPRYNDVVVHGNILIEPDGDGRNDILHFGGDSGKTVWYRRGPLHFYRNTVVSFRRGNTTLFRLSAGEQIVDARNNIFAAVGGGSISVLESTGKIELGNNWINEGWRKIEGKSRGVVEVKGRLITGREPGFANIANLDLKLISGSPCLNAAGPMAKDILSDLLQLQEYLPHQRSKSYQIEAAGYRVRTSLGAFPQIH